MLATTPTSQRSSGLDTHLGDLVLRISGSPRGGEIVRLKAAKCTIGSGQSCTLRLRAPGVAPLHCLLLRGRAGAVARCWSPDTRLNHKSFTDADLSSGDRLSVGPIDLEVLDVGTTSFDRKLDSDDARQPGMDEQREQLAAHLAELETERNALSEQHRQWQAEQDATQRDADERRDQLAARIAELETERNTLAAEQDNIEAQRNTFAEERRQWQAKQEATQRDADEQRDQLAARIAELEAERNNIDAQRNTIDEDRRQWQAEQEATQRAADEQRDQLAARIAELETERNTLAAEQHNIEAQRNTLAEERRQWQAEQDAAKQDADQQRAQLAARIAELEAERNHVETQRDTFAEERQQWQAEQEATQRDADEQRDQLAARIAELEAERNASAAKQDDIEAARNALAQERRTLQARQEATQQAADQQHVQLAAQITELETERTVLAEQRRQWQVEQESTQQAVEEQRSQLAVRVAALEAAQSDLAEQHRQWQAKHEGIQQSTDDQRDQLAASLAELEAERNSLAADRSSLEAQRTALAEEHRRWQAQQETAPQSADPIHDRPAARFAEIETEQNALVAERDALQVRWNTLAEERRQGDFRRAESPPAEEPLAATERSAAPAEMQELQFQEPAPRAPVDLNDVLRRIGAKLDRIEGDRATESAAPPWIAPSFNADLTAPAHASEAPVAKEIETTKPEAAETEEESIEEYMNKLMHRVRTSTGESEGASRMPQRSEPSRFAREPSDSAAAAELLMPQPVESMPDLPPAPSKPAQPRSPAPEKRTDLSALRELANLSAKSAISEHARNTLIHTMYSKLIVTSVALVAGIGLLWMWSRFGACELTLYSSLVAIAAAVFWGAEYALLTGRLIIRQSGRIDIDWSGFSRRGKRAAPPAAADPAADNGIKQSAADTTPAEHAGDSLAAR